MTTLSNTQIIKIKQMLAEGKSVNEIARTLGVSQIQVAVLKSQKQNNQQIAPERSLKVNTETVQEEGDVLVGFTENTAPVYWNPFKAPNPHLMIVGGSGHGKTYCITGIISDLAIKGIPTIVIGYSEGYEAKEFPQKVRSQNRFQEINVARDGISLNPLDIRERDKKMHGPLDVALRVSGTINRIFRIGVQQHAILQDVIMSVYRKKGIYKESPETWSKEVPTLSDVKQELQLLSEDEDFPKRRKVEETLSHISSFFAYNTFNSGGVKFDWKIAVSSGKISVLQLYGLEGNSKDAVIEFLLWDLYSFITSQGTKPLSCFVVLDEAHNLDFEPQTPVDKIVREARKFGLAAILASQEPNDFHGPAFTNTGTKICFQVPEEGKFVKKMAAKARMNANQMKDILSTLQPWHPYVLSDKNAVICRVASHNERGLV